MIDFAKKGRVLRHTWSNCVGAGRANEGLRADWQEHLKVVKEQCGFRYLRFHGLFHDDMHVYTEIDGVGHFNFQYVDKLFDYMLSCGIRPFVEFGFMPEVLASGSSTQFWWKGNITPPASYQKWGELIDKSVRHWIMRYGIEEVENWYFEIWNEPNLNVFWDGSRGQYFELYKTSVCTIKAISKTLRVGGPATSNFVPDSRFDGEKEDTSVHATFKTEDINSLKWRGVWIREFLEYCEKEQLPVDFVSTHPYPTDFALDNYGNSSGKTRYKDSLLNDIQWLKREIAQSAYPDAEIHLTEWSSSPSSRDYSHDYLPAAAYVMRSNLQCAGMVETLSYWTFTDVFEELGAGPEAFHGGFGMLNLQGIKKPVFHAYRMLNDLGEEELEQGEGWIFTKKKNKLAAAFYHYPASYHDTVPMSKYPDQTAALECQNIEEKKTLEFEIKGLTPGDIYSLEILKKNTAVDLWNQIGAPAELSFEAEKLLKKQGETLERSIVKVDDSGKLKLEITLDAWNIAALKFITEKI